MPPPTASPPYEVGGITHMVDFTGLDEADERAYALNQFGQVFRWDIEGYRPEFAPIAPMREFSGYQISGLRLADGVLEGLMLMAADFRGLYYGYNLTGVAGIGVDTVKTRPIELPALRGARQIMPGYGTWAVMSDGLVHSWGMRDYVVRTESGYHYNTIIPTPAIRVVREVAVGLLIMEDGTLWMMQFKGGLQLTGYTQIPTSSPAVRFIRGSWPARVVLADGTTIYQPEGSAEFVTVTDDFVAFSKAGAGLKADGTVWVLEGGSYTQIPGLSGITQIDGWIFPPTSRSSDLFIALRNDGRVFVLGWLGSGPSVGSLLGDGQVSPPLTTPVIVEGLTDIVQVEAMSSCFIALRADGEVFTWGNNDHGQLGTGDTNTYLVMKQPHGLSNVVRMWAGGEATIAKRADGSFWGWGFNWFGNLTDGSNMIYGAPNLAYGSSSTVFNAGNGFTDWLTTYFNEQELRDIELFADVKDPDADGLVNLVEYALGTNPRKRTVEFTYTDQPLPEPTLTLEYTKSVPSARLEKVRRNYYSDGVGVAAGGTPDVETSHLVMTVPRAERRSDVDYIVEVSDDLEHWHFGPGHTVEVLNTLTNLVVYDARPMEENRKRFIRLRLVRNNPGQTSIPR